MENLRTYLKKNRLITDGAMGTYYAELLADPMALVEQGNIEHPELIEQIHNAYISAGAQLIRTNTFASNSKVLGEDWNAQEHNIICACRIARKCAKDTVYVAGDIGPIKESAEEEEEILAEYQRICDVFLQMQVDLIQFETFADLYYIEPVVAYIRAKSDVFISVNFCINKNGFSSSGISANRLMEEAGRITGIDACGFNCGVGSGHMSQLMKKVKFPADKFISCLPNAGYPEQMQNRMVFMDNGEYFAQNMQDIASLGLNMVGGCCGTRPEYIRMICENVRNLPMTERQNHVEVHTAGGVTTAKELHSNEFFQLFQNGHKVIAVELDPPYDADYEKLIEQTHYLKKHGVDIVTMADSPMGRSRVDSVLMSIKIAEETGMRVMPHICCRDKNVIALRSTLLGAYINGIRQVLLVTGDPVPAVSRMSTTGVFDYNSIRLMNFVKEMNNEHFAEEPIYYGGALNVTLGRLDKLIERMQKKIDAGAKYFMTQPVFTEEAVERLKVMHEQLEAKILCGIMPLISYRNANFIKNEFLGIQVPDEVVNRYSPDMTREEGEQMGAEIASEMIAKVSPYVDGFYFMLPFNRVSLMDQIRIS